MFVVCQYQIFRISTSSIIGTDRAPFLGWCRVLQGGARRVVQGGAGWCRVVQGGAGWCRVVQGGAGWCRVVQGGAGWCRVVQGGAGWCRVVHAMSLEYRVLIGYVCMYMYDPLFTRKFCYRRLPHQRSVGFHEGRRHNKKNYLQKYI